MNQQIQLKFILPFSTFSETFDYPKSFSLKELRALVWDYFQLPAERQFIRIRTEDCDVRIDSSNNFFYFIEKNGQKIRICDFFPLEFYQIETHTQILIEDLIIFKERMQFFQTKKRVYNPKRHLPDSFETSKQRQSISNILNKLIEVLVFFLIKIRLLF